MDKKECEFEILDPNNPKVKTCKTCKWEHHTNTIPSLIHRQCKIDRGYHTASQFEVKIEKRPKPEKKVVKKTWTEAVTGFLSSMKDFVEDPRLCTKEEYKERTDICAKCPERNEAMNICTVCKCSLAIKTKGKAWKCPLGKWENGNAK